MQAKIIHTGNERWDSVAAAVGNQIGTVLNKETHEDGVHYSVNFPKLTDGSGYGGLFLGVPASVCEIS